jgi:hypothetical protein
VALHHFDMRLERGMLVYPYRLEPGPYLGRMAMALISQERLLDTLHRLPPAGRSAQPEETSAAPQR